MKDAKHILYFLAGAVAAGVIQYMVTKAIDKAKETAALKSKVLPTSQLVGDVITEVKL